MSFERLVSIMRRLRDPVSGCEWDRQQNFATIAPYTIEEAYEVADAIARDDMPALIDELGDLQLQVVFHAMMAEELGHFTLDQVLDGICDKLERRHPHLFGDEPQSPGWEEIKAAERQARADESALDGVALALPALERAAKLQRRAARTGFDWPDPSGPRGKIDEELAEFDSESDPDRRSEELGDLLFAVVNLARKAGVDPGTALDRANRKFRDRFEAIERLAEDRGLDLDSAGLEALDQLWDEVKAGESV